MAAFPGRPGSQQIDVPQTMQQECAEHDGEHKNLWHPLFDRLPQADRGGIIRHKHTPQTSRPRKQWRVCWLVRFRIRDKTWDGFGGLLATAPMGVWWGPVAPPPLLIPLRSLASPTYTTSLRRSFAPITAGCIACCWLSWPEVRSHREWQTVTAARDVAPRIYGLVSYQRDPLASWTR